jgi:Arc/MetJ-type ribon-helix-helix transcriptional regulator
VIVYGGYVDYFKIRKYWKKETGMTSVWIKRYHNVSEAIREGLKYATKPIGLNEHGNLNLSVDDLVKIHLALKGKRRVQSYGSLFKGKFLKKLAADRGVDLDDDKPVKQTHCGVCDAELETEPYAVMKSFIDKAKSSESFILREGINFNISNEGSRANAPP